MAVDVLSRRVFGIPIKNKTNESMKAAFDTLFKDQMPITPQRLFTDQGFCLLFLYLSYN